jgi:flagellum-specific peptidoglycan hydrolase FlgJ
MSYDDNAQKFANYAPAAARVHSATGVFVSVILAHWALETTYFTSGSFTEGNNIGGIKNFGQAEASGTLYGHASYDSVDRGVDDYIRVLNLGYLAAMRSATTPEEQIHQLDISPYAEDPNQGANLLSILNTYGLTGYDSGVSPAPAPSGGGSASSGTIGNMSSDQVTKYAGIGLALVALLALASATD